MNNRYSVFINCEYVGLYYYSDIDKINNPDMKFILPITPIVRPR